MSAVAALPLSSAMARAGDSDTARVSGARILTPYFSRSGNTRVVAGLLKRAFKADVFEIRPATPYPEG